MHCPCRVLRWCRRSRSQNFEHNNSRPGRILENVADLFCFLLDPMMLLTRARVNLRLKHYYRPPLQARCQHDLPHKEYFQHPRTYPATETTTTRPHSTGRPFSGRLLRSILWAGLFSALGFAYVEVWKTARWVDKSKRDPQREEADMQEIRRMFKDDPLVKLLEADPSWQNMAHHADPGADPHPFVQHSDQYMSEKMGGSKGLQTVRGLL